MRLLLVIAAVLACAAITVLVAGSGTVADAIGLALAGVAGIAVVQAVFYAVGDSEDRERARGSGRHRPR
jgi:hypothetical protein